MLLLWWKPGDYRFVFWWACVPTALTVLVLWFWVSEVAPPHKESSTRPRLSWKSLAPEFRLYVAVMFIFTLGNSSDAFLLLRAESLGIRDYMMPLLWMVLHLVKTATNMPGGSLADRWGRRRTIIIGWIIYAFIYAGFAFASESWHVWALFALYGIYFGLTEGAERALVCDLAPENVRGTAFGFFHLAVGLAALPASVMFGYIWDKVSVEAAFGVGAGLALLAGLMLAAFVGRPSVDTRP
jgi:predicted MFS family arabinose efflux permease